MLLPDGSTDSKKELQFTYDDTQTYLDSLEKKTESLICELEGVRGCNVMITLKSGYEYLYASDARAVIGNENRDSQKEYVIIQTGGDEQPVLIEKRMPEISGVAVVCNGISADTEYKIICLLQALFNIASNKISIN